MILLQLVLAHILTDFVIQSNKWVEHKKRKALKSQYFWLHVSLSGVLTYLILMQWTNWIAPLSIFISHGLIDYWKISIEQKIDAKNEKIPNKKDKIIEVVYFFTDQLLHLVIIILVWLYLTDSFNQVIPSLVDLFTDEKSLIIITAFIIITWPAGKTIGKITETFKYELSTTDSLKNAGTYIGITERILVFIFVLLGQFAAIGFLIAGKSILRVSRDNDDDARKKTEYVLIGTMISFTVAILIGLLTRKLLSM
ncbi:MAG: DUF3307 domain-containing protein [Bacteroidales bacterium]|nr:DUF3307 domain-containing protein [Bacteroidales bacterium]